MAERRSTPDERLTDAEYRILARFRFALRVFLRFSKDAARRAGLTPDQHQLLLAIRGSDSGQPTVSELAEALQNQHNSTVELIDRAADAGLLSRQGDPTDGRLRRVRLTARGSALLESLSEVHREELRRFREEMADIIGELG